MCSDLHVYELSDNGTFKREGDFLTIQSFNEECGAAINFDVPNSGSSTSEDLVQPSANQLYFQIAFDTKMVRL